MPRQSGRKSTFRRKLLILNRITALSRFCGIISKPFKSFQNRRGTRRPRVGTYTLNYTGSATDIPSHTGNIRLVVNAGCSNPLREYIRLEATRVDDESYVSRM